jgi:glycosyltransferase involved in cell wall biosynthesis
VKALFLYNKIDLTSDIPGGVQICSQQFLEIVKEMADELYFFEVSHSKSIIFRLLHRLNLDAYQSYQPQKYKAKLLKSLLDNQITHIFINKSELLKFSKLIKEANLPLDPKIVILSHGNESGDLLGDLTGKRPKFRHIYQTFGVLRIGMALYLESWYRKRYVDLVCTMSAEESALEKWLGINNPFFIPRLIDQKNTAIRQPHSNIFGYVGTLNHMPNLAALYQLCEKLDETHANLEIRIVGGPKSIGEELSNKYAFIKFLGPLTDPQLLQEVESWAYFINPIFNYSRGASMKLAKAIEWEIPVLTTVAGRRGYFFKEGKLIETEDTPVAMVNQINELVNISASEYETLQSAIRKVKYSVLSASDIATDLKQRLKNL